MIQHVFPFSLQINVLVMYVMAPVSTAHIFIWKTWNRICRDDIDKLKGFKFKLGTAMTYKYCSIIVFLIIGSISLALYKPKLSRIFTDMMVASIS